MNEKKITAEIKSCTGYKKGTCDITQGCKGAEGCNRECRNWTWGNVTTMTKVLLVATQKNFEEVEKLDAKINDLQEKRDTLAASATSTTAPLSERVQSSASGATLCNQVTQIIELDEQINKAIDEYVNVKHRRTVELLRLPELELAIFYEYYFSGKGFTEIATDVGLCTKTVKRAYKRGLWHLTFL